MAVSKYAVSSGRIAGFGDDDPWHGGVDLQHRRNSTGTTDAVEGPGRAGRALGLSGRHLGQRLAVGVVFAEELVTRVAEVGGKVAGGTA